MASVCGAPRRPLGFVPIGIGEVVGDRVVDLDGGWVGNLDGNRVGGRVGDRSGACVDVCSARSMAAATRLSSTARLNANFSCPVFPTI